MTSNPGVRFGIAAAALLALGAPFRAQAGSVVTSAHPAAINLNLVAQDQVNGDDRPDRIHGTWKNVFQACVGRAPTRTEALYVLIDCIDPTNNAIEAVNVDATTKPATLTKLMTVGKLTFDMGHGVVTEKKGVMTGVIVPVQVAIGCGTPLTPTEVTLNMSGVMNVRFSPIGKFSSLPTQICPLNGSAKLTGTGFIGGAVSGGPGVDLDFIVNDNSSISANNRDSRIDTTTPVP